jgi:hypothetical protein
MRVDRGDGTLAPTTLADVEPGDWLTCKDGTTGQLVRRGSIPFGKGRIPGFLIKTLKGTTDFILADEAIIGVFGTELIPPTSAEREELCP